MIRTQDDMVLVLDPHEIDGVRTLPLLEHSAHELEYPFAALVF